MSIENHQYYKCSEEGCKALVEVVNVCGCGDNCTLTCCDKPLEKLQAKTADAATEKHVPVIEKQEGGYLVKVGSVPHPMEPEHHIEFIELRCASCNMIMRKYLKPGDKPEAFFPVTADEAEIICYEHCNIHGLWKS